MYSLQLQHFDKQGYKLLQLLLINFNCDNSNFHNVIGLLWLNAYLYSLNIVLRSYGTVILTDAHRFRLHDDLTALRYVPAWRGVVACCHSNNTKHLLRLIRSK